MKQRLQTLRRLRRSQSDDEGSDYQPHRSGLGNGRAYSPAVPRLLTDARRGHAVTSAHLEPITFVLRVYEAGSYAEQSRYSASATVQLVGDTATVCGLSGNFNRAAWRAVCAELKAHGASVLLIVRHGKQKRYGL